MKVRAEYNTGYKTCGAWAMYIPPRHKKRIKDHCKKKNQGRRKDHYLRVNWWDFVEIKPFTTEMYA